MANADPPCNRLAAGPTL